MEHKRNVEKEITSNENRNGKANGELKIALLNLAS